ncbi:serine/threonine-protein kinase [Streptomyces monashensis]|uniref:serine/threonine-protein kinase n=1 Tax=Streptomyces monashensis TaxID=1678012 RepID=UPI0033D81F9F
MKEARYAARLHPPNVVAVFGHVAEGDACWIVMEYVPSRSLAQLGAERGPLTPQEAGSNGGQIAAALTKSHDEGVAHGDVPPENILVTEAGVARLTDFGIARAPWSEVTRTGTHTTTGTVRGKPRYLAPEVAKGRTPDVKDDVFCLGASLFAAIEGRSPCGDFDHVMGYLDRDLEGRGRSRRPCPRGAGPWPGTPACGAVARRPVRGASNRYGHADCMQTFASDTPPRRHVLIEGNRCEHVDGMCVMAEGPNDGEGDGRGHTFDFVIRGNYCETLKVSQALMFEDVQHVTVVGNTFAAVTDHAIGLAIHSTGARVHGSRTDPRVRYEVGIDASSRPGYRGPKPGGAP